MLSTNFLGTTAISLGIVALLACFIGVPILYQKCDSLKIDLTTGMTEFNSLTDNTWNRLMTARSGDTILSARTARQPIKGRCNCYDGMLLSFTDRPLDNAIDWKAMRISVF